MKLHKYYWTNKHHTRCYVSYGYIKEFPALQELYEIARNDYPDLDESAFEMIKITRSDMIEGYTCISFLIDGKPLEDYVYLEAS